MSIQLPAKIAGLTIRTSGTLATDPNLKFCGLILGPPKVGKTTLLKSFAQAIERHEGKPSLIIACEPADGGGLLSIAEADIPFVQPKNLDELKTLLAGLAGDQTFGGVFLDNAGELVSCLMKPVAMALPSRENQASRAIAGVPERSDYQTMGELFRKDVLLPLIGLSKHSNNAVRKHIIITTLPKEKTDNKGNLIKVLPDLPGAMALSAQALVQFVGGIDMRAVKHVDEKGILTTTKERVLISARDQYHDYSDRYNLFPPECPTDMMAFWEKYWLPRQKQPIAVTTTQQ
jgi:GTPase SAR1 family protein